MMTSTFVTSPTSLVSISAATMQDSSSALINSDTFLAEYNEQLLSSFDKPTRTPSVPLLDGPFEYRSCVYCANRPAHLFDCVLAALSQEQEVDYQSKQQKFRIKGRKFAEHIVAEFEIHVSQLPEDYHDPRFRLFYVIEFQRRSGDAVVFQSFLTSIVSRLQAMDIVAFSPMGNVGLFEAADAKAEPAADPTSPTKPKKTRRRRKRGTSTEESGRRSFDRDGQEAPEMPKRSLSPLSDSDRVGLEQIPADSLSFDHDGVFIEELLDQIALGKHQHKRHAAAILARESHNPHVIEMLWRWRNHEHDQQHHHDADDYQGDVLNKLVSVMYECLDVQVVRALGFTLCNLLNNCEDALTAIRNDKDLILKLSASFKRWSRGIETRIGDKTVCVIPSRQTAITLQSCIEVIRGKRRCG